MGERDDALGDDGHVRIAVSNYRLRRRWPVPVAVAVALIGLTVASYVVTARTDGGTGRAENAGFLAEGDAPMVGATYLLDLTVLCQLSIQHFGGHDWQVATPRPPYPGPHPEKAGNPFHDSRVHGYATLVDDQTMVFRADTAHTRAPWELTFHPLTESTAAPDCASAERGARTTQIVP